MTWFEQGSSCSSLPRGCTDEERQAHPHPLRPLLCWGHRMTVTRSLLVHRTTSPPSGLAGTLKVVALSVPGAQKSKPPLWQRFSKRPSKAGRQGLDSSLRILPTCKEGLAWARATAFCRVDPSTAAPRSCTISGRYCISTKALEGHWSRGTGPELENLKTQNDSWGPSNEGQSGAYSPSLEPSPRLDPDLLMVPPHPVPTSATLPCPEPRGDEWRAPSPLARRPPRLLWESAQP